MDDLPKEQQATLDRSTRTIVDQVESLKSMVNAFTDYARPAQLQSAPVNINDLVRDVVDMYRGKAASALPIALEIDEGLPDIRADAGRLRQVLHNLLLNARDALANSDSPSVLVRTRLTGNKENLFLELSVEDNGPGFPDTVMQHLFEPYVTGKEKGTGLGLAIVKKIIEEHSGSLSAANTDQGARIEIRLPLSELSSTTGNDQEKRA
jgi:nitrogen fixation/metabolism regulation signal transduction histidine kinase